MKRFIIKILLFFAPFFIICVHYLFVINNITGDIGWLGYIPFGEYEIDCNLPESNRVIDCYSVQELKNAEIISIGDSFNKIGKNGTFSNHIGNELNRVVYRMQLTLNNYDLLDSLININSFPNCKVMILESVERCLISRLNYDSKRDSLCFDNKLEEIRDWESHFNLNAFLSFIRILINFENPISSLKLNDKYFSCDFCTDKLYFLNSIVDTELTFKHISEDKYLKAIENLMMIKSKIESKGIKMIFVVAADKYDMYYDYTLYNEYGKNPTLEYFSDIDSTFFVNTKSLLKPYLDDGVQDIYLANDTHWSPIAAEIVGKHVADIIETQGYLND